MPVPRQPVALLGITSDYGEVPGPGEPCCAVAWHHAPAHGHGHTMHQPHWAPAATGAGPWARRVLSCGLQEIKAPTGSQVCPSPARLWSTCTLPSVLRCLLPCLPPHHPSKPTQPSPPKISAAFPPPSHSWSGLQSCIKHLHQHQQHFPHTGPLATTVGLLAQPRAACLSSRSVLLLILLAQPSGCASSPSELSPAPLQGEPWSLLVPQVSQTPARSLAPGHPPRQDFPTLDNHPAGQEPCEPGQEP